MTPPIVLAFLLCDHIWFDPSSGSQSILGTFSGIAGLQFPAMRPVISIYLLLTGGHGTQRLRVELVDVDEERPPIFELQGEVDFADPRQVVPQALEIPNVQFPSPGDYRLKLFVGSEFLMERRLEVTQAGDSGPQL